MRYPAMNKNEKYRVEVPQLSGGVNLIDPPERVEDDQLTEAENVWWERGALRTRPGLHKLDTGALPAGATGGHAVFVSHNAIGEREQLLGQMRESGGAVSFYGYSLSIDGGLTALGQIHDLQKIDGELPSCMGVKASSTAGSKYYFFLDGGRILQQSATGALEDAEPYIPTVMVNGKPASAMSESERGTRVSGVLFEGYNMLTPKFKCSFTTDGENDEFWLPAQQLDTKPHAWAATVEILMADGTTVTKDLTRIMDDKISGYTAVTADQLGVDSSYNNCSITIMLDSIKGIVSVKALAGKTTGSDPAMTVHLPFVRSNNLTVTASKTTDGQLETICRMTRCTWFGGDRSGIGGGTRLFVCGDPQKPNLVCWSDVDRPLYFPENNYAYIGDADQPVTGFGKQADLLVIFKPHEIYSAQYVAGSGYSADDVAAGRVVDVAAAGATFPITPLHPSIGCDSPDSIRLVNNRLVWASSDAHIYMMPTVNQWSERNVRDITARIRPRLERHSRAELTGAIAGEYSGYYTLLAGDTLYLLDAGNSAFQSYAYYSSEKKATRLLPWYLWTLTREDAAWAGAVSDGETVHLLCQNAADGTWTLFDLSGTTDDGDRIESCFATKRFDFGRPDRRKAVKQLYFGLSDEAGTNVRVDYVTENGVCEDVWRAENTGDGGTDGMTLRRLTPNINRAAVFGLRFSSTGTMAIDRLVLYYQMQGVMR